MKKYLFIFKSELMSNMQYITNILIGFINYFIIIFIFLNLWKYIYSNPNELINGYNMNQMIWYVTITEILWSILSGRKLCKKITDDVKAGNITYNLNKPYSYISYILFSHLGDCFLRGIFYALFGIIISFIFLGSFPSLNILSIILVILTSIIAIIISTLIIISLGLLSFFIEDANPFYWLYSKVILILGTIFPIEFFPVFLQPIFKYSPIYVVSYGPAKLFVDFNWNSCIEIFILQGAYLILSVLLSNFIYKKGVRKLNVNGG